MQWSDQPGRLTALCVSAFVIAALALALGTAKSAPPTGPDGTSVVSSDNPEKRASVDFAQEVNGAFGLADSAVVSLETPDTPGIAMHLVVPIGEGLMTLDLVPHASRSADYQILVPTRDDSHRRVEAGPVRTLRGTVIEVPGSIVAASRLPDGFYARIILSDEAEYWIEPIAPRLPGAGAEQHVVYRTIDIIPSGGSCGAEALAHLSGGGGDGGGGGPRDNCGDGILCIAEVAFDADYEYFQDYGSVSAVESRINNIIAAVNIQYERDVEISFLITTIIVRDTSNDPYNAGTIDGLLVQFRNYWNSNYGSIPRDLAELFTGRNLNGGVIGIAWMNAICTTNAYSVVENCCNWGCTTDLTAHEMGHNWGADHCSCSTYTMNAGLTCWNRFHPTYSIPEIVSYRNTREFCLDAGGGEPDETPPEPDPMVFRTPPHALSSSVIRMEAIEATDERSPPVDYEFDFRFGGPGGSDSGWQSDTMYADFGLEPNTQYTYRVRARDSASPPNETEYSPNVTVTTYAVVPGAPILSNPTSESLDLDVDPADNPAPTELAVRCAGSDPFDPTWDGRYLAGDGSPSGSEVWQTDGAWGTTTVQGLQPGTLYTFDVKARNLDGIETDFGPGAGAETSEGECSPFGDVNQDGQVTGADIAGFVRAKLGQPPAGGENQACADNGGTLEEDIADFVTALLN